MKAVYSTAKSAAQAMAKELGLKIVTTTGAHHVGIFEADSTHIYTTSRWDLAHQIIMKLYQERTGKKAPGWNFGGGRK